MVENNLAALKEFLAMMSEGDDNGIYEIVTTELLHTGEYPPETRVGDIVFWHMHTANIITHFDLEKNFLETVKK